MQATIRLNEALDQMLLPDPQNPVKRKPFSIVYCSLDKKRGTGGERIKLENVVRIGQRHSTTKNNTIGVAPRDESQHPRAIHTWLIEKFNDLEVII